MLNTPFSPWPAFTQAEADAVTRVLLSNRVNYWTGEEGRAFEREFAEWSGCRHAVALSNGTVALEIALTALDIGPGDEVIVSPRTFIASAACIAMAGARPVFADVDPNSQNITAATIAEVLSPRTRAVICVHLAGWPCDMDPIMALAAQHGLKVIEDCAQAHGARYKDRSVGAIGDIGAWSFCQDKIMTTGGEGGMVTTQSQALWSRLWSRKDHGKAWNAVSANQPSTGFRWLHESFGTNGRMTEMQAAIGRLQLQRMPAWTRRRSAHAHRLAAVCRRHAGIRAPLPTDDCTHGYYKFYAFIDPGQLAPGWTRDGIVDAMIAAGVPCYQGTCPEVYLEKAFDANGYRPLQRLPVARCLGETSLMWLVHPTLTDAEIDKTCHTLDAVLTRATSAGSCGASVRPANATVTPPPEKGSS